MLRSKGGVGRGWYVCMMGLGYGDECLDAIRPHHVNMMSLQVSRRNQT
jgi:hypothetical protein